jgi:uncharacterized membrane protein
MDAIYGEQGSAGDQLARALDLENTPPLLPPTAADRAKALGWFSLGLATAQLLAPGLIARAIGGRDRPRTRWLMRAIGARELLAGLGLLGGARPGAWMWSRTLGDVMDLALLGTAAASASRPQQRWRAVGALAAVAGVTALDFTTSRQLTRDSAGDAQALNIDAAVTVNRSPAEVYAFWRDLRNLARFMTNVESVEVLDQRRSRWHVRVGGRRLVWEAAINQDRPNQLIGWQTLDDSDVVHNGEVRFEAAPGNRGTEICVTIDARPPGGAAGRAVARLARLVPEQQVLNDLRRLKQVLEVGEVIKSDASIHAGRHPARPEEKQS